MKRHNRDDYYVVGEGILTFDRDGHATARRPSAAADMRKFRFSRLGPAGEPIDDARREIFETVSAAMTTDPAGGDPESGHRPPDSGIPAGFTYLGQFVDHDLTKDVTADQLGQDVTVDELLQGRSPALDLDSLYGRGPEKDPQFYAADGLHIKTGRTSALPPGAPGGDNPFAQAEREGFDLPRANAGSTPAERRLASIPDQRNDENLAVAQTHLAFIRLHNRVIDEFAGTTPSALLFTTARDTMVRHYQWMLATDFLPRIVEPEIVTDVFTHGRKFFEVPAAYNDPGWYPAYGGNSVEPGDRPTMPVEFSIAAYRLGHSMVRDFYNWNAVFNNKQPVKASLLLLFAFSGTSGILAPAASPDQLSDPTAGTTALPGNWVADFRRLYDFTEAGRADLTVPADDFNVAKRIDTLLVNPLHQLPLGSFGGRDAAVHATGRELNLAFRNLTPGRHGPAVQRPAARRTLRPPAAGRQPDHHRKRGSIPRRSRRRPEEIVRAGHAFVVLRPAGGRAQRRAADRRGRPDRSRGLPPRDGRQPRLHRPGPGLAPRSRPGREHLPDDRPAPVRLREQQGTTRPPRLRQCQAFSRYAAPPDQDPGWGRARRAVQPDDHGGHMPGAGRDACHGHLADAPAAGDAFDHGSSRPDRDHRCLGTARRLGRHVLPDGEPGAG